MKYIVVLADGMADYPIENLGNKTPLEFANTPNFDFLAKKGTMGLVKTVPDTLLPGSDTANLSVLGYDPEKYYSGRSPFETASIGIPLELTDITFRCNFVTLSEDEIYEDKTITDHSADEITTAEATELIIAVNEHFKTTAMEFHPGISYRHILVWHNAPKEYKLIPPHDILERKIGSYLPTGEDSAILLEMMKKSYEFLKNHPINVKRKERGLRPANSIWLWGEGHKPALKSFVEKYNAKGSIISAVDLIKGIGVCTGMNIVEVEGATGNVHTNYIGKAKAALKELASGQDFVYVHVEAPDECGHRAELDNKVLAIESIDKYIVGTLLKELKGQDFRLMVLPDHPTPISLRTHTLDPVPYVIYDSTKVLDNSTIFNEKNAAKTKNYIAKGYTLMDKFILDIEIR
ncbi:MAG: cofactor-independent phosphoglycerate mutase [Clostridiaceae bacterium]|nr:cofactor-independent phosphoglycerate mutase [Clostridiaceae bacterium]